MKIAVIDLGTNTFHLLIVQANQDGSFTEVCRDARFIHLGENGIETIGEAPYKRGLNTMNAFALKIMKHRALKVSVIGTAALRNASNGGAFIEEVKQRTGIQIETITGDKEAELIYYGVRESLEMTATPMMIIDVGGGSVEFIIANRTQIFWARSFPIGVAVLHYHFHQYEPISAQNITAQYAFLEKTLEPLAVALQQYPITTLIGASGTFDVLEHAMKIEEQSKHSATVQIGAFQPFFDEVIQANLEERIAMESVPNSRAKLIVVALILVDFILKKYEIEQLIVSSFAMKEGMIQQIKKEYFENEPKDEET